MHFLLAPFFPSRRSRGGSHSVRLKGTAMRQVPTLALATLLFAATAPNVEAYYDVTIGTTDTAGVWNGNEWIPNGTGSTVSASTIESKLVDGAVTIGTGTAGDGGTEDGDITVSSAVSWDANTLTLTANVLNINAVMTAGGSAGLAVNVSGYFDGTSGPQLFTMINTGMGNGGFIGRVDFTGSNNTISFNGAPGVIITTLGEAGSYCNDNSLQGSDNGYVIHVLGADIDATPTASWNNGLGFMPLGFRTCGIASFGAFPLDGLGHTIDGLTINRPTNSLVGLFESVYYMAQNIGLTNVNIVGGEDVGALGGVNGYNSPNGRIANVFVTGSVTATGSYSGGLLGHNNRYYARLSMTNVYSSANVTGIDNVGGLLGGFGSYGIDDFEGGVTLDGAYTTGTVSGRYDVGGLIGTFDGSSGGVITNVYTTATVNATATPDGYGYDMFGGLGTGTGSYLGWVGPGYVDGQVQSSSSLCYPVTFEGLAGREHLYHNSETVHLCGGSNVTWPDVLFSAPLTNAQMKQQASYDGFDFDNTWVIYEGQTTPILRSMEGLFDSDGDGYYNNEDAFPGDPTRWLATPDAFPFAAQTGVATIAEITSNTITVSGINVATPISIASCTGSNCQYAINGGDWRSDAGTVKNGDTVQVRQTSSDSYATQTHLTLTIGDVSETFSVTTEAAPVDDGTTPPDDSIVDDGTTPTDDSDGVTEEDTTQSTASGGGGGAFGLWFLALLLPLMRRRRVV